MFHAQVQHDFKTLNREEATYKSLPKIKMNEEVVKETFLRIKREVRAIVEDELERIMNTPGIARTIVIKSISKS